MSAKTRTQVFLSDEQRKALAEITKETGASMGELIRRAVDRYVEIYQQDKQKKQK